ncbi:hypothetical protein ZWY2020_055610 [Hordeum vulgare]|nr:hypothetical protein ZWY2020_055610 [Hordeum vulgare]
MDSAVVEGVADPATAGGMDRSVEEAVDDAVEEAVEDATPISTSGGQGGETSGEHAPRGPPKKRTKTTKSAQSSMVPCEDNAPSAMCFPPSQILEITTKEKGER